MSIAAVVWLRSPEAVRERCHTLLSLAEQDRLPYFVLHKERLAEAADYVAAVIRCNCPDLDIPYHSRWRHFETAGIDRWGAVAAQLEPLGTVELARASIDLCTVSVLLDAGAGPDWRYTDPVSGHVLTRSEGLAAASLSAFCAGLFSSDPGRTLSADATGLSRVSEPTLAAAFQVSRANPLIGLEGRVALLRNLGAALRRRPDVFGERARLGHLFDHWLARAPDGSLPARDMLITILNTFASIWPGRMELSGENLGDVWPHPMAGGNGPAAGLVPFHKLSQWLCYSLVEVLERASIKVTGLNQLTGLAEYRNGGLLIDLGVLSLRDPKLAAAPLGPRHTAIVEWRALTVALLDRLAPLVRQRLAGTEEKLPLARLLQGGTWEAGRKIARERRPGGPPPITLLSDGSLF